MPAGVKAILRLEGAAAFAAAIALYAHAGFSWPLFALLILAPDLAMLPYLDRPEGRRGGLQSRPHLCAERSARARRLFFRLAGRLALGLIWIAHIGMDRMLGYGLKYPTGFGDTHLGRIGEGELAMRVHAIQTGRVQIMCPRSRTQRLAPPRA